MSEETNINISLNVEAINYLLTVLGDLPTKTGAYPLMMEISRQAKEQVKDAK